MTRYAALLRGVNVNGITVKSTELAALFRDLGFTGVKTVLASGNVLFETDEGGTPTGHSALKTHIEKALGERFGYDAWIVLVEHDDLAGIVDGYPYPEVDDRQPYVVFFSDPSVREEVLAAAAALAPDAALPERAEAGPTVVYWEVPKGSSTDTALSKFLAKSSFKATTTTRNLRTLRKLL
ncbi:MAG: DUF1697 domain-containing protein [Herbiconiux sp.]|uniref:DUF1697 domain-containing protein n=1 Tax=Herbiconiux sp. TaxID=1871186 RepID=UPI0012120ED7|nr:DUF1697 domain-containing protein [Herbiconiux sp.]TAJ47916.1 MAG: DUF1697 domain-containing protein [Herbiconiux sp.]